MAGIKRQLEDKNNSSLPAEKRPALLETNPETIAIATWILNLYLINSLASTNEPFRVPSPDEIKELALVLNNVDYEFKSYARLCMSNDLIGLINKRIELFDLNIKKLSILNEVELEIILTSHILGFIIDASAIPTQHNITRFFHILEI